MVLFKVKANSKEFFCWENAGLAKACLYLGYSPLLILFQQGNSEWKLLDRSCSLIFFSLLPI